jgi:hypothetical protein
MKRFHDDCRILEIARLYRCGLLNPGQATWEWELPGEPRSTAVIVTEPDVVRLENQRLPFEWKPCKPTRGADPLWRCPGCDRRCRKLYSPPGGLFQCRGCWELEYRIWHEPPLVRRLRYVGQIGVPLAGSPVGGQVPPPNRQRKRSREKVARQARIREVAALVVLELLRED